jgi:hypothetical protein
MTKKYITQGISITQEQKQWLDDNAINLSKLIRNVLKKRMEDI